MLFICILTTTFQICRLSYKLWLRQSCLFWIVNFEYIFGDNGYLYPSSGKLTAEKILSTMIHHLHAKKNLCAITLVILAGGFSITKRRITHWPFRRCLLWTQIRLNAVEVMRLLHDTLTLKEAKVALNTDMYHWTWPHKCIRLTVSLKEVLFCKLSALRVRVHHVDTNHCDLHMTSKMKGRSFFKILWNLPQLCKCLLHWVSFCFWVYLNLLDFLADLSLIFTWILHPGFHC